MAGAHHDNGEWRTGYVEWIMKNEEWRIGKGNGEWKMGKEGGIKNGEGE